MPFIWAYNRWVVVSADEQREYHKRGTIPIWIDGKRLDAGLPPRPDATRPGQGAGIDPARD